MRWWSVRLLLICVCSVAVAPGDPPPRRAHVMVSTGEEILMWGGYGGSATGATYLTDTWLYTMHSGWQRIEDATAPAGYRACAAWDSDRNLAVSFGGTSSTGRSAEVHEYDALSDTWSWIEVSGVKPSPRLGGAMAYIPGYGCLVTGGDFGGDETWLWNGASWRQISSSTPESVYVHSIVWDPVRERAVQFGGLHGMDSLDSVWEFDPTTELWSDATAAPGPAARHLQCFAYVPDVGVVIGYGKTTDPYAPLFQDLWGWDGEGWTEVEMDEPASPRFCSQTCWLPSPGLVMFGGETTEILDPDYYYRTGDTILLLLSSELLAGLPGREWRSYP